MTSGQGPLAATLRAGGAVAKDEWSPPVPEAPAAPSARCPTAVPRAS
jgi:hypothetical protein